MPRTIKDSRIDSRAARLRLAPRAEPYWRKLTRGCFIGYRRNRGHGSWIARYRDPSGRQNHKVLGAADDLLDADGLTALSFDQAQEKARAWLHSAASLAILGREDVRYTVAQCVADYLAWVKEHPKSHHHLETYANAYILPRLGHLDVNDLTTIVIRRWHQQIAAEPPRLRSRKGRPVRYAAEDPDPAEARRKRQLRANRHLVTLRAALTRAWRDGLVRITRDEWLRVEPFKGVERQRQNYLNRDQACRLLNACHDKPLRDLVRLALLTGARYGELCAFNVGDFNADAGTLAVRTSKSGKGRHIILNDEGTACCRDLAVGRAPREPLLVKPGEERWRRDHVRRAFKAAVERAGLDPSFTFHELRHTWASLSVMNGAPLMVVAHNLGHRDTRMVELHYGHLAATYVARVIRETAPSFGPIEPVGTVVALTPRDPG